MSKPTVFDMVHQVIADTDTMLKEAAEASGGGGDQEGEKKEKKKDDGTPCKVASDEDILKLASACDYLADHLPEIVDDRSPQEKLAEHMAIQEAIMQKLGGASVPPAVPVDGVESAIPREAADAPGTSLDAGESGEATPAHKPDKETSPGEKTTPADAGNAMPTNKEMMMPDQPEDILKQARSLFGEGDAEADTVVKAAEEGHVPKMFAASILRKMASAVDNPPSSETAGTAPALQKAPGTPVVQSQGSEVGENTPRKTAPTSGEGGGRQLIASNEAAIDAKKREAKSSTVDALSEVLTEPAMSAAHDKVLEKSLQNTSNAGVKIAATRAILDKVANASEEGKQKVMELLKEAQGMAAAPAAAPAAQPMAQPPAAAQPAPAGGGMPPQMAQGAGVSPEEIAAAQQLLQQQQPMAQPAQAAPAAAPAAGAPAPGQAPVA